MEYSLEINTNKSELIVQRNKDKTPVKLFGETLIPKKGAKYLGYEIRRRTTSNAQMQARTEKTKQAINALMYTLRSAKGINNCNKANMAKSIITQTATYAVETSSSKQTKTILNTLERVQRKMAILRASKVTAIETTLEDLGWLTIEGVIDKNKLNFRKRLENEENTLHKGLLEISDDLGLPWSQETKKLKEKYNIEDTPDLKEYKRIVKSKIRKYEYQANRTKCAHKVTCADFLNVTEATTEQEVKMKTYIKHNSNRRNSIATIHGWRAGYNDTAYIQHLRHQQNNNTCQTCGEIETVRHITNECPAYQHERQILIEELIAHEVDENIDLYDIVLCSKKFEEHAKWPNQKTQQIDGAIKNFVDWVYRRRNCKKLKRPATKSTLPVFLKRPKGSLT